MTNGELMNLVMQILTEDKEIPDISAKATARLTLAGMVQLYKITNKNRKCIQTNSESISILASDIGVLTTDKEERKKRREKEEDGKRKLWYGVLGGVILLAINILVQVLT